MDSVTTTIAISAATSFTTALATKGADGPANTLNLLWQATLGRWDNKLQAYIDRRNANFQKFANDITEEVKKIPDDKIKDEPDVSIIGPALEASKYYIEQDIPRKMFARLIAASMDKRKDKIVHHSFVDIIKQMSPIDAKMFMEFENPTILFNCLIKRSDTPEQSEFIGDIYLSDSFSEDISFNSIAVNNLERLGLIYIPTRNLGSIRMNAQDENYINKFKETSLYKQILADINNPASPRESIEIITYMAYLTRLSFAFRDVCL